MLRVAQRHQASTSVLQGGSGPALPTALKPRLAPSAVVVPAPASRTIAVRGHVRSGSAAALIVEPQGVCIVAADRSRRRRVRRFGIREVLAVEENRRESSTELVLLTSSTEIVVMDVDIAQAWTFGRELRQLILDAGQRFSPARSRRRQP